MSTLCKTLQHHTYLMIFYRYRPEAVAQCIVDLIKDESTEAGQVVKVTYEDGVEYLNFNDVRRMSNLVPRARGKGPGKEVVRCPQKCVGSRK